MRQQHLLDELAVEFESRAARHLLRPIVKAILLAERQFPEGALEPHAADQEARDEQPHGSPVALTRILAPIHDGERQACRNQTIEDQQKEILPIPKRIEVAVLAVRKSKRSLIGVVICFELPDPRRSNLRRLNLVRVVQAKVTSEDETIPTRMMLSA